MKLHPHVQVATAMVAIGRITAALDNQGENYRLGKSIHVQV